MQSWQIELAQWMADYYFSPFYKVLKLMLPERLWAPSSTEIPYTLLYERTNEPIPARLGPKAQELIKLFAQQKSYSRKELESFSLQTLKSLETKGLLKKVKGSIATTEASQKNSPQSASPTKP